MKFFLLFGLIVGICITTCGCTQPVTIESTDTAASPTIGTIEPDSATGMSLATLSNEQPNTSLMLEPGVILVSFQTYDPQKMQINQECPQSWGGSSEIRMIGPFNGSLAYGIPVKDECIVNISSSGTWTAQVSRMKMNNPLNIPVNLSGSGTTVSPPFTLEKGHYIFQRNETETASPAYYLTFSNGSQLMDANNTFVQPGFDRFSTDTFRIIDIPESGTYFMSVIADDNPMPWNASIIAMPQIPVMGSGPAIREAA